MAKKINANKNTYKKENSGTLTIRFDPKLRYQLELTARLQCRNNLSGLIEDCVRKTIKTTALYPENVFPDADRTITIGSYIENLWDVDISDRVAKLGIHAPHLLEYKEQKIWKLITQTSSLWIGEINQLGLPLRTDVVSNFDFVKLRNNWDLFVKVANGELEQDSLKNI